MGIKGGDCGHECCDERSNPFHDHFLNPEVCPVCAAHQTTQAYLRAEIERVAAEIEKESHK